jgi:hypothetical protein
MLNFNLSGLLKIKSIVIILILFSSAVSSQTQRVLIIGDSWAQLQIDNDSHNQVFADNGYANISISPSSDTTSDNGLEAADWASTAGLQTIVDTLNSNPEIDTVQLTIGGNDFLNAWHTNMTAQQESDLQQQISSDLNTIISAILAIDTNIEILLSFYDYPNFEDTIGGLFGATCNDLNNDMQQPTTFDLNTAATEFEEIYAQIAMTQPRVFHVSHFGLMQSYFGFPDDNIQPGDILPPGDLTRPSPLEAMRDFVVTRDCFHLSPLGYEYLVQNSFDGYFKNRFSDVLFSNSFE